jgi:small subunit ribosomal protein S1
MDTVYTPTNEELVMTSWDDEEGLEYLARLKRNEEIARGVVRYVKKANMRIFENGSYKKVETEVAILLMESGHTVFCTKEEFSEHEFKTIAGFTGTIQEFIIDHLDLENRIATVSVKKADEIKSKIFWEKIVDLHQRGELEKTVFEGIVYGANPLTRKIYVRVEGTSCYMDVDDWDWNRRKPNVDLLVSRGEKISVVVTRFDVEKKLVRVSRKHTMRDPFLDLELLAKFDGIAGVVTTVSSVHGVFVQLDNGLEVKATVPRQLEPPVVGDVVRCKILNIDHKKRRCRVVIIGYPRGKKKIRDISSFLFGE